MSKYTKENPFEFGGVKVWQEAQSLGHRFVWATVDDPARQDSVALTEAEARALHAFIETERYPDEWTEQEDGSWMKGRWVGFAFDIGPYVCHDDFPHSSFGDATLSVSGQPFLRDAKKVYDDFLAHLKATEFVPQDVPEVGCWIRAELRDGRVVECEVKETFKSDWDQAFEFVVIFGDSSDYYINLVEDAAKNPNDILDWSYIDPPQPEEPTGLGAVVEVGGIRWVRLDDSDFPWKRAEVSQCSSWAGLIDRGPITVKSPGVEA